MARFLSKTLLSSTDCSAAVYQFADVLKMENVQRFSEILLMLDF